MSINRIRAIGFLVLLFQACQIAAEQKWEISQICGHLEYVRETVVKGEGAQQTKGLRHVKVSIFRTESGNDCCGDKTFVASAITGFGGHFKLPAVPVGEYWFQASYAGKDYRQKLRISPQSERIVPCATLLFDIHADGKFDMGAVVTVD